MQTVALDLNSLDIDDGGMGALLCLLSAAGFGAMAVFGKLAYDEGVGLGDLLIVRFTLAAIVLVAVVALRRGFRGLTPRTAAVGLAMGAVGYAAQSGAFFAALTRIDASLLTLILYVYPVLVMVGAVLIGRERVSPRRIVALGLAAVGISLVLLGAATQRFDWLGAALGLTAALVYTVYILVGERVTDTMAALTLAALVCVGASGTYWLVSLAGGGPDFGFGLAGWGWLAALSLVSTVAAIVLFFAGLSRVGPSVASILSIFEPVVTVSLAAMAFGEQLGVGQLLGGALVLGAVLVVQWPSRRVPQPAATAPEMSTRTLEPACS